MHRVLVVLVLLLVSTACAKPVTPDSKEVSQIVERAVQATLAAQPASAACRVETSCDTSHDCLLSPWWRLRHYL